MYLLQHHNIVVTIGVILLLSLCRENVSLARGGGPSGERQKSEGLRLGLWLSLLKSTIEMMSEDKSASRPIG